MILYTALSCTPCLAAKEAVFALSQEFHMPYEIRIVDKQHLPANLPGVPVVEHEGVLYYGVRFPDRLRKVLQEKQSRAP